jgi:hypothetical protein
LLKLQQHNNSHTSTKCTLKKKRVYHPSTKNPLITNSSPRKKKGRLPPLKKKDLFNLSIHPQKGGLKKKIKRKIERGFTNHKRLTTLKRSVYHPTKGLPSKKNEGLPPALFHKKDSDYKKDGKTLQLTLFNCN